MDNAQSSAAAADGNETPSVPWWRPLLPWGNRTGQKRKRAVEVGWALANQTASFIWDAPRPFTRKLPKARSSKAVNACPAVLDYEARHFTVPCPIDLHLRCVHKPGEMPKLMNMAGEHSAVRDQQLNKMGTIQKPSEWRDPTRPVFQIATPYVFISDEPVYINQTPPYLDYGYQEWPGILIGGRFPIQNWIRPLMWAFEWVDTSKDLILKRGEPWFHVRFEVEDPSRPVRLVEAEVTPEVRSFIAGANDVANYVGQTFSLIETAKQRRPKQLLFKK